MYGACDQLVRERDHPKELQQPLRIVPKGRQVLALDVSFQIYDASQVSHGACRMRPLNHHGSVRRLARIPNLQRL